MLETDFKREWNSDSITVIMPGIPMCAVLEIISPKP